MLYDMALEVQGTWPKPDESTTRSEMRAAARLELHGELLRCDADRFFTWTIP